MNWSILRAWRWVHGKKTTARRRPTTAQLAVEALETRVTPSSLAASTLHVKPLASGTTPRGYTPIQILEAYSFYNTGGTNNISFNGVAGNGAGQTIAIVDAYNDPNIAGDLAAFDAAFQLPAPPSFSVVNQSGHTTGLPAADSSGGWEMEEALDVEWAHAIAPAANIVLVEASAATNVALDAAVTMAADLPGVSVISMSWASSEFSGETGEDGVFTTPSGHQGVTFVASSGDSGSPAGYPAYSSNVVAVGGTSLNLNSNNSYQSESAWNGSGGGTSTQESEPAYQRSVQNTGKRTAPDVAFDANPNTGVAIYDSFDNSSGPWTEVGGTSVAAPAWAGILAIVNQGRVSAGEPTLNGATQTLPALYSLPTSAFHDITTGSNGGYSATAGYDEVTGLGTPIASNLIPDLVAYGNTASAPVLAPIVNRSVPAGGSINVTLNGSDPAGLQVTYTASITGSLAAQAYQLDQRLGLNYMGSYYQNAWGQNEKWMTSASGTSYCILPNGQVRRWAGTMAATMQASNLIATLNASYYANPSLLWNAPTVPTPTVSINGNQLTIAAPANATGTFQVTVTAAVGSLTASQTFTLSIGAALQISPIANQTLASGGSLTLTLSGNTPGIAYSASLINAGSSQAYQLEQQLQLRYMGSYYTNMWGQNEKWLSSASGTWYCILPDGQLRRWAGTMTATMQAANLIATLTASDYADPSLLWNAQPVSTVTLSVTGNQLTIQAPPGVTGTFQIQVAATAGGQSVAETFTVTVAAA